ncbi:ABC transporter ATP-binding protein [Ferrimicrobium sp.]|uniref:ABC transporter ATP-binding protein n=1 Tax=Ferrimicrobium sp. TaxID=2926050 RepID=UPI002626D560|nr:ABC transporter ATP-binding protein [Ferrimicrobium sp.]
MSLLEVTDLRLSIDDTELLRGISFQMAPAERLGLIGESGSGKSLTALTIMGLLPPRGRLSGSVRLADQELTALNERRYSRLRGDRIAMIFQEPMTSLNPLMRVGKQVGEVLRIHQGLSHKASVAQAITLLERVGFDAPAQQARAFPHQLSGGQRQRVMIATAIACNPDLILADEPTTALDVTVQAQVLKLLGELTAEHGCALMLISHDLAVVASVCERIQVMYGGVIVESGPTDALLHAPQHPYTRALLATSRGIEDLDQELFGQLPTIPGVVAEAGRFPQGCTFRGRCERESERCRSAPSSDGTHHQVRCWHPYGTKS